ncbi:MAG: LysR family transcriptional regulator [Arenicellales bacterium WSBS_2016_MAG_OTU3]
MFQKWLEAFHTVAVTGGFTRAAEVLNVGQPTVSTHAKSLEEYFQVELFHRSGRTMFTPTGEARWLLSREACTVITTKRLRCCAPRATFEKGQLLLNAAGPFDVMEILRVSR